MISHVGADEFILPQCDATAGTSQHMVNPVTLSPAKKISERFIQEHHPPESPGSRFARDRFGCLLSSIQQGDNAGPADKKRNADENDRRGPGRPKKSSNNNKEMIFELRGKSFAMRQDVSSSCSEYQLCRSWLRGKMGEPSEPCVPVPPCDPMLSVDFLATREIFSLPRPNAGTENEWPKSTTDQFDSSVNHNDPLALKNEYIRHWKAVKDECVHREKLRRSRHSKSIAVLEAAYTYARQNEAT